MVRATPPAAGIAFKDDPGDPATKKPTEDAIAFCHSTRLNSEAGLLVARGVE